MLPEKTRRQYIIAYTAFMEWRAHNNVDSFSEDVLVDYFECLSKTYKSTSLWKLYSMLRNTLIAKNGVYIESYYKLREFLKRKSEGYHAKKAKTFIPQEITKFINDAPDNVYLATKVALIMGIMGACRANELHAMTVEDVQDLGSALIITIPNSKSKVVRKFTITNYFYDICKKYADLRPKMAPVPSFFLNFQRGKCTVQKIGINKFGAMGKQIAQFLGLPNPELYTGHCFRRSSATLGVDAGGDITVLRRNVGWRSVESGGKSENCVIPSASGLLQPADDTFVKNKNVVSDVEADSFT